MNLSDWILSIVGVIVLSVIVQVIVPEGQTSKVIKGVFAFVVVVVIVSPMPTLINKEISLNRYLNEESYTINVDLSDTIFEIRIKKAKNDVKKILVQFNLPDYNVQIEAENNDTFLSLKKIIINLDNSVLTATQINTIDVEGIKSSVALGMGIKKEQVYVL